jgi:hypothetical protein
MRPVVGTNPCIHAKASRLARASLSKCKLLLGCAAAVLTAAALLWPTPRALAQPREQAKLVGSGAVGNAGQGNSVALSGDGNTLIVGGPFDGTVGAAWVFTRSGGTWSEQAKLVGTGAVGPANAEQGFSVALSADGNTAILGAPFDGAVGAAWVFTRSGGTWSQQAKLVGTGVVGNPDQGYSVALSGDGNTALLGGPFDTPIGNGNAGAAWVFARSGGAWTQQAKLVGANAIGASVEQGWSVALSGDGNTALVGSKDDNAGSGAGWVFIRSGGALWSQQTKLGSVAAVSETAQEGFSVALSNDGNTAILGAPGDNNSAGAAWVFTRSGGTWSEQAKLVGTGGSGLDQQGWSVALSGDGNTALVGGPNSNNQIGAVWSFARRGSSWAQQFMVAGGLIDTAGAARLGWSVALSCNTFAWGGPSDFGTAGAAWVFVTFNNASHDFNGDCRSDILWHNTSSGQAVIWEMDGAVSVIGAGSPGSAASPWAIVGQRDFNGDGYADILWRNGTTGQLVIWLMNGTSIIGGGSPGSVSSDWIVAATGDFNGDGMGDILWYNKASGQVLLWFLNGTSAIGGGSPGTVTTDWMVAGSADFNRDGYADILWYNSSTGQALIWFMKGTSVINSFSPGSAASPWTIAGTGDFNGDGAGDILWYNSSTGQALIWLLAGTTVIGADSPGSAPSPWAIVQAGDFNGDGMSDVLWYNTSTGQLVIWLLNGTTVIGGGSPGTGPSPWQVQGLNSD